MSAEPIQIIEAAFVDQQKLLQLLKKVHGETNGKSNFRVELRLNKYKIYQVNNSAEPKLLTKEQIEDLSVLKKN